MYKTAVELRLGDRIVRVPGYDNPCVAFNHAELDRTPVVVSLKLDVAVSLIIVGVVLPDIDTRLFPLKLQGWPDASRQFSPKDVFTLM